MHKLIIAAIVFLAIPITGNGQDNTYTIFIEGYDWGAAVSKVVIPYGESVKDVKVDQYEVMATRSSAFVSLEGEQASATRQVLMAYISDAESNHQERGTYVTLLLHVSPTCAICNPMQYARSQGNHWVNYQLDIRDSKHEKKWNVEAARKMPLVDQFDMSGSFNYKDDLTLLYASYQPEDDGKKAPLIIWLHGGGEGGDDPTIPLLANRAANYASDEIQVYFGGAHVLVPQSPTFWMQNEKGDYTRGKDNDVYNEALMALIRKHVKENPNIDIDRIYVGGCSNGGYMSLKLILLYPEYFAAGFISALAYQSQFVSDEQIERIKDVPIWFVHSKDDQVTVPDETVVPIYHRLKKAGADNVYFSYYDHVTDITGVFGGDSFHYNGHWSWIYSHANKCMTDFDGSVVEIEDKPITIMEWMAAQKN